VGNKDDDSIKFTLKQMVGVIVGMIVIFGGQSFIVNSGDKQTTINVSQIKHLEENQDEQKQRIDKIEVKYESIKDAIHSVDTKVSVLKETNESLKKQNSLMISLMQDIQKKIK